MCEVGGELLETNGEAAIEGAWNDTLWTVISHVLLLWKER
jgi:hypothetical protein